ncbi:hypothetical protein BGZ70_004477 [Mortierella alpina]|uniref:Protein kinase domain-containing protein n=1 Tax=Mortierella alpina TaxID=64518 RepID=A0A9P6IR83_MORAP|nr:hypothetical protein BGZ70_004477 [Mortierella alpina]
MASNSAAAPGGGVLPVPGGSKTSDGDDKTRAGTIAATLPAAPLGTVNLGGSGSNHNIPASGAGGSDGAGGPFATDEYNHNHHGGPSGPSDGAAPIANKHRRKESINLSKVVNVPIYGDDHATHGNSSTSVNSHHTSESKRPSGAKFFGSGKDYQVPGRRPSPTLPAGPLPITATGPKEEVGDSLLESVEVTQNDDDTSSSKKKAAVQHANKDARKEISKSSKTTTTVTSGTHTDVNPGEPQEILSTEDASDMELHGHARFESSTSSGMTDSSSVLYPGRITTSSSASSISPSSPTKAMLVVGGMAAAGGAASAIMTESSTSKQTQNPQEIIEHRPAQTTTNKTITLTLKIVRYERSDASLAVPTAAPGTLMFNQVEMVSGAPEIRISGSAFSHVRDVSKMNSKEENLPSPVVPGPSGAIDNSESEPRERSLRWMKNGDQWKREAGMLQQLKSDHIVEIFKLYTLPTFAEYRFVSVMGPFTRTLDSYIRERENIRSLDYHPTPAAESLAKQGPLTSPEIKSLTESIASALKWCHDKDVVHLNLSPASIFLQEYYSEPDGQGGYRFSSYSTYSGKSYGDTTATDSEAPRLTQQWKLWNFSHARFVGEAVDLSMEKTRYTAPEILAASRHHRHEETKSTTTTEVEDSNNDGTLVTKTTTTSTSEGAASSSQETGKLMAAIPMDMWSLGQIVYEMHAKQPMFTSSTDAIDKLTLVWDAQDDDDDGDLDKAKTHERVRHQLEEQAQKIEQIDDFTAHEAIKELLEMDPERRLKHEGLLTLYFGYPE